MIVCGGQQPFIRTQQDKKNCPNRSFHRNKIHRKQSEVSSRKDSSNTVCRLIESAPLNVNCHLIETAFIKSIIIKKSFVILTINKERFVTNNFKVTSSKNISSFPRKKIIHHLIDSLNHLPIDESSKVHRFNYCYFANFFKNGMCQSPKGNMEVKRQSGVSKSNKKWCLVSY